MENNLESEKTESFEEKVNQVLDLIRPNIRRDGGDVKLIEANESEKRVKLKLVGACSNCTLSTVTLNGFIETILKKKIPELKVVESE